MDFDLEVWIEREPAEVFAFLRDKDLYPQEPGSPVLALDQLTRDPPGVGTQLIRRETVEAFGAMRVFAALAWRSLGPRLASGSTASRAIWTRGGSSTWIARAARTARPADAHEAAAAVP